ncbi:MAG: hypothetical protein QHC78_03680 [Pigmentiphaga sp.]|uniref:hypothetical protein n=1 Tax=Pigmentiphaga sp. TaxID=1977564 RepID=UPI0029A6D608|nr:hypothetical protein [Pigmentiphaga sp.]MDX3904772.1 hypothetical protein [Pigmentiphaga sp.]
MAVWLAASLPALAHAQSAADMDARLDTLFGEHVPYRNFFEKLQKAVATDDKAAVAAMVQYPFRARLGGKAHTIRDAGHFVADYDQIMTPEVKRAIAAQTYPELFANWQGISIGSGEIWFSGIGTGKDIRIIAINH